MATPSIKYTLVFCLIALALFHVHTVLMLEAALVSPRVDKGYAVSKDTAKDGKSNEYVDEKRKRRGKIRFGDGCALTAHNGGLQWCCVHDNPDEQRCFNGRDECQSECL